MCSCVQKTVQIATRLQLFSQDKQSHYKSHPPDQESLPKYSWVMAIGEAKAMKRWSRGEAKKKQSLSKGVTKAKQRQSIREIKGKWEV